MTTRKTPAELFLFESDDHIGAIRDYAIAARALLDSPNDLGRAGVSALGRVLDIMLDRVETLEDDHRDVFNETFGKGAAAAV